MKVSDNSTERIKMICQNPECGNEFFVIPSRARNKRGKYCSHECQYHKTYEQRFWEKVKKGSDDECWEWTGSKDREGYGRFWYEHRLTSAHQYSWILHNGSIPPKNGSYHGTCVLHKCDNPSCVNPNHLFLGTQKRNMEDRESRGRHADVFGEKNPSAKLTSKDVSEIRKLYRYRGKGGLTLHELSDRFGVSFTNIHRIVTRANWVKEDE